MAREMRYEKGVPLTEEEKAGGGKGAGRKKKSTPEQRGEDINPNANAGAFDQPIQFGNLQDPVKEIFAQAQQGNPMMQALYGGRPATNQAETMQLLRDMTEMYAQSQEPISQTLTTQRMLRDPVGFANKMASLPAEAPGSTNPFAPGGAFAGRPKLTPEAAIASQGNNAVNQWAQLGGITQGGQKIDPEELKRLNAATYQARKTYM